MRSVQAVRYCLTTLLVFSVPIVAQTESIYIKAGSLVDTLQAKIVDKPLVEIHDKRIVTVESNGIPAKGATVIDLGDATILPGLADLHTHLTYNASDQGYKLLAISTTDEAIRGVVNARKTLLAGFTTARNVGAGFQVAGASGFSSVSLRNAINAGSIAGPRLQVAGPALSITGGHCDNNLLPKEYGVAAEGVADGPWEVRKRIRDNRKYGVDLIKICATGGVLSKGTSVGGRQYSMAEMQAIVDEAHTRGMKVAAHAHGAEGILYAIEAGVDSIEHASLINAEGISLAKKMGTFLAMDVYNTEFIQNEGAAAGMLPESLAKDREVATAQRENFRLANKAGVKIVYATDSAVYPHGENAKQFSRMVKFGMTPMQAIQSATVVAAELLGWEGQTGAIAAGYFADIIAVRGNPLDDVSTLEEVSFVMKDGTVYKREE